MRRIAQVLDTRFASGRRLCTVRAAASMARTVPTVNAAGIGGRLRLWCRRLAIEPRAVVSEGQAATCRQNLQLPSAAADWTAPDC